MRRGLFRIDDPFLGECAHVSGDNGDAYPLLNREMYRLLGFEPPFDGLPTQSEYQSRRAGMPAS